MRAVTNVSDDPDNDVVQQYVLPDYAQPEDVADPVTKYGYVLSGPGARHAPSAVVSSDLGAALDAFIAGGAPAPRNARTDHQVLRLGEERFQLYENLFAPARIGLDEASLPELIAAAIEQTEPASRDLLWSTIVLIVGGARVPGLCQRLNVRQRL